MNTSIIITFLHEIGFKQAVLVLYAVLAVIVAGYNLLYLSHSLHVTTDHMGLNAPKQIRTILKMSIFLAIITASLSIFFLLFGWY